MEKQERVCVHKLVWRMSNADKRSTIVSEGKGCFVWFDRVKCHKRARDAQRSTARREHQLQGSLCRSAGEVVTHVRAQLA